METVLGRCLTQTHVRTGRLLFGLHHDTVRRAVSLLSFLHVLQARQFEQAKELDIEEGQTRPARSSDSLTAQLLDRLETSQNGEH